MSTRIDSKDELLRRELKAIEDETGRLTPELVVESARDPKHPLHDQFEWDDSIAAEQFRCQQARALIRRVEVIVQTTEYTYTVPKYIRDPSVGCSEQGYRVLDKVARDREDAVKALEYEFGRAYAFLQRAYALLLAMDVDPEELSGIMSSIDHLGKKYRRTLLEMPKKGVSRRSPQEDARPSA